MFVQKLRHCSVEVKASGFIPDTVVSVRVDHSFELFVVFYELVGHFSAVLEVDVIVCHSMDQHIVSLELFSEING